MRHAGKYTRRASIYLALLAISVIVTVIGVSALLAARLQHRAAEDTNAAIEARFYAQSAIDLALLWIKTDLAWRTRYANGTWIPEQTIGRGKGTIKLVDEIDGNLTNDATQPVRLYGKGVIGDVVRIQSVLLALPPSAPGSSNLLLNPGMESGTANWSGLGYCILESRTDGPHGGSKYIRAKNRSETWHGPSQDITGKIVNGTQYDASAWVKTLSSSETLKLTIRTNGTSSGTRYIYLSGSATKSEWRRISGTLTPTWSGDLIEARFYVETSSTTQDFNIDDASLIKSGGSSTPAIAPVAGSWQQGVLP